MDFLIDELAFNNNYIKKICNDLDRMKIFVTGNLWEKITHASMNMLRKIPSSSPSHPNIFQHQLNVYFANDCHNFTNSMSSTRTAYTDYTEKRHSFFVKVQLFSTE